MATSIIKKTDIYQSTSGTYFDFVRKGNICMAICYSNLPARADGALMDTIPVGFRPAHNFDAQVFDAYNGNRLGTLRFSYDGTIKPTFGSFSASRASRFAVTYIV